MGNKNTLWNQHYHIRKEIGEGQYGHVFLARDIHKEKGEEHRRVAIKVLKPEEKDDQSSDDEFESKITLDLY